MASAAAPLDRIGAAYGNGVRVAIGGAGHQHPRGWVGQSRQVQGGAEVTFGDATWRAATASSLPSSWFAIDEGGIVVFANEALTTLLDLGLDDLLGHNVIEFLHPDDQEVAIVGLALALAHPDRLAPESYRVRRRDGSYVPVEAVGASHLADPGVRAVLISTHGLTHRAYLDQALVAIANGAVDEALARLLESMEAVFFDSPCGIIHGDRNAREATGVVFPSTAIGDPARVEELDQRVIEWLATIPIPTTVVLDELPAPFRAWLREGLGAVAIVPVPDPASDADAIVVCWNEDELLATRAVQRIDRLFATVLRLALERRHRIAEDERHTDRLQHEARSDALTGLANRAALFAHLDGDGPSIGRAALYIDVDDFKSINDTFGHAAGDRLLGVIATRLAQSLRPQDLIARLGGDEFAVILDGVATEDQAQVLAARVLTTVGEPTPIAGSVLTPSLSIGVAVDPARRLTGPDLLDAADRALYRAKHEGKRRVVLTVVDG